MDVMTEADIRKAVSIRTARIERTNRKILEVLQYRSGGDAEELRRERDSLEEDLRCFVDAALCGKLKEYFDAKG